MGLGRYRGRRAGQLSGGTQRKLSVAIALIGEPDVMLLDEPSTGVDPATRRFLWEVIRTEAPGRATVLSTHSMEEAEALCSHIAIMTAGKLRCVGSPQELKDRFGRAFSLEMKCNPARGAELEEWVESQFGDVERLEVYAGHYKYRVGRGAGSARHRAPPRAPLIDRGPLQMRWAPSLSGSRARGLHSGWKSTPSASLPWSKSSWILRGRKSRKPA